MSQISYNVVIIGVSYFDGMASSARVRNLLEPLIKRYCINANNLIYQKDANGLSEKRGVLNNVNYCVIGFRKSNPFSLILFIWNGIRFIKKNKSHSKKNIIYNYSNPDLKNIVFLFYAKLIGYKIILDIVEDSRYSPKFIRFLSKIRIKSSIFFINYSQLFADGILTISEHLYKRMIGKSNRKLLIHLIPITVNFNKFEKKFYQIPKNFKIFYGGSFGEKDGLEYLIKAFEKISLQFDNVSLILSGRGTDHDMKHVYQLIDNSCAKEKIIFKGYLSNDEYYKLINECDLFCMTRVNSKYANAGFPFKLGEFLATGKAVIATDVGDVAKYIQHGKNALLIRPSSVEELAKALLFLLNNPEQINALGIEGRKTAECYFDSEKVSMKLFSIFKTL